MRSPLPLAWRRSQADSSCPLARLCRAGLALFAVLWTLLAAAPARADLVLEYATLGQSLTGHLSMLVDPGGRLSPQEARANSARFKPLTGTGGFGYSTDVYWLRFTLTQDGLPRNWLLELPYPYLDDVRLYTPRADGSLVEQRVGDHMPFASWPLPYRNFLFPLHLEPGHGTHTLYLRVATADSLAVPLVVWEEHAFQEHAREEALLFGLYYGLMLAMLFYNAFIGTLLRDRTFYHYVACAFFALLIVAELNGHTLQYLWPNFPWLADQQHNLIPCAYLIALVLWQQSFLNLRQTVPLIVRPLSAIVGACAALILFSLIGFYPLANRLTMYLAGLTIGLTTLASIICVVRGSLPARIFLAAQLLPMACSALIVMRNLGYLSASTLLNHSFQIATALEMLLFSIALAYRVYLLRRERHAALDMAQSDPLTGLLNRHGLERRLARFGPDGSHRHQELALMVIDLDGFKPVNDRYGHKPGDLVLQEVARRLKTCTRTTDFIARPGNDEFIIGLPGMFSHSDGAQLADKILEQIAQPIPIPGGLVPGGSLQVTASIGVAFMPGDADQVDGLLEQADLAMYVAKSEGRNRYELAAGMSEEGYRPPAWQAS